jgi:hypothetical protein
MEKGKTFTLTEEQMEKFNEWRKSKDLKQVAIGGAYTFCFTPTGIGIFETVKCIDGTELDLTEYDKL